MINLMEQGAKFKSKILLDSHPHFVLRPVAEILFLLRPRQIVNRRNAETDNKHVTQEHWNRQQIRDAETLKQTTITWHRTTSSAALVL